MIFFLPLTRAKHSFVLLHEGGAGVENELEEKLELGKAFFEERSCFTSSNDYCNLLLGRD